VFIQNEASLLPFRSPITRQLAASPSLFQKTAKKGVQGEEKKRKKKKRKTPKTRSQRKRGGGEGEGKPEHSTTTPPPHTTLLAFAFARFSLDKEHIGPPAPTSFEILCKHHTLVPDKGNPHSCVHTIVKTADSHSSIPFSALGTHHPDRRPASRRTVKKGQKQSRSVDFQRRSAFGQSKIQMSKIYKNHAIVEMHCKIGFLQGCYDQVRGILYRLLIYGRAQCMHIDMRGHAPPGRGPHIRPRSHGDGLVGRHRIDRFADVLGETHRRLTLLLHLFL